MQKITYGSWLNDWLNVYKKPYVKTWQNIARIIRLHIPDYVKKTKVSELNAILIQKSINSVKNSRTRLDVFDVYHGSLVMAYRNDLIAKDISQLLIKPKHNRKVGSALTRDELNSFILGLEKTKLKYYFIFCLLTGVRRSEALLVTWEDIDFTKRRIHIRGTKTTLSDRYIPLFPELETLLSTLPNKSGRLFRHRAEYVSKQFKKLCPNHKLHDLRHTFATRCLELDVNMKIVQLWLGHSRMDTTSSIYTHVTAEYQQSESEKIKFF